MHKYIVIFALFIIAQTVLVHAVPASAGECEQSVRQYWSDGVFTDHEAAARTVEACLAADPADAEAHYLRAVLHIESEDYQAALKSLDQAIKYDHAYARAYTNRAELRLFLGQAGPGLEDYDAAVALEPGNAALRMKRANVLLNRQKFADAAVDYGAVIELAPDLPEAWHGRSMAMAALGRKEEMCSDFRQLCGMGFCMNLEKALSRGDCPQ